MNSVAPLPFMHLRDLLARELMGIFESIYDECGSRQQINPDVGASQPSPPLTLHFAAGSHLASGGPKALQDQP